MDTLAFGLALGVGLVVAALRMYLMGDLPPLQVLRGAAIWGLGSFMAMGGALWFVSRSLLIAGPTPETSRATSRTQAKGAASRAPARTPAVRPAKTSPGPDLSPEALNQVEEEATLVERPAPARIQGAAPPEVAAAIRDLMKEA